MRLLSRFPSKLRLGFICTRLFYRILPRALWSGILNQVGNSWKSFCPACELPVAHFAPLPRFYFQELKEHGSDLRIADFETCNFQAYQCPYCGATDRDRLCALYLQQRLPRTAGEQKQFHLLDIAPAAALSSYLKCNYSLHYRTADLFMKHVDDRVDITSMDCYPDASFNAAICSHVLEHVADDRKALAELLRVLKPGGWGIAMVPISLAIKATREDPSVTTSAGRWKHFGQDDHLRLYSREGFLRRLQDSGFAVRQFGKDYFGTEEMGRCGLSASSVLYVIEKPN
jgi:hypothetical protein